MKNLILLFTLAFGVMFASCSKDSEDTFEEVSVNLTVKDHLNLTSGNLKSFKYSDFVHQLSEKPEKFQLIHTKTWTYFYYN